MRMLRLFWVHPLSVGLFLRLIHALTVGYVLDSVLKLWKLDFDSASVILASPRISLGSFSMAWSSDGLLTDGKGHPQGALGASLAPNTARLIPTGPFKYTRDPMVFGYLMTLAGVGWVWGSAGLSMRPP